jgi:hypothetical protein
MKVVSRRLEGCIVAKDGGARGVPVRPADNDNEPECLAFPMLEQGLVANDHAPPLDMTAISGNKIRWARFERLASFAAKWLYLLACTAPM